MARRRNELPGQDANLAGTFRVGPAQVQSMYAPEFVAYSAGAEVEIGMGQ